MEKRSLPVKLTTEELSARRDELANLVSNLQQFEADKAESASSYGAKIKDTRAKMQEVSRLITTREEWRPVEVEEVMEYETNTVKIVRLDTKEVVSRRSMTAEERQIRLFKKPGDKDDDDKKKSGKT